MSVITAESLTQVTRPEELTSLAPAVQISNAGGAQPLLYVRGVGTQSSNPYTDSAIAINYDGIYLARPTSTAGLFYDLERLEVLKGPQGTLYGRNATGGALNVIPALPKLNERSASAIVSAGNYESVNGQASLNLPVGTRAAIRLAGTGYSHDGYLSDGSYSEKGAGGRAQILFEPHTGLSLRLSGDYFDLGGKGPSSVLVATEDLATGTAVPVSFDRSVGLNDPRTIAVLNQTIVPPAGAPFGPLPGGPALDNQYYGVTADIRAQLGAANLSVLGSFRRSDLANIITSGGFYIDQAETDKQHSLEVRLDGSLSHVDWLIGGLYSRDTISSLFAVNSNYLGGSQKFDQASTSKAVFGRLTWHASDVLRFTGAARQSWDRRSFDGVADTAIGLCVSPDHLCPEIRRLPANIRDVPAALLSIGYLRPPGAPVYVDVATGSATSFYLPARVVVDDVVKSDKLTYRAAIEFEPRPQSLLYASVETGYRGGGFSFSSARPSYAPENIIAYTIGSKNRFFSGRLQFNIEGFIWKYQDQQVAHQSYGVDGSIEFVTENIGRSTNKGVEVELVARPLPNTRLSADIQYLDAHNDDFVFIEPDTSVAAGLPGGTLPPATRCPYSVDAATATYRVDCSGTRALRVPKWTINLTVEQRIPLSASLALIMGANTHYQSDSIVMFERREFSTQKSYWQTDASVALQSSDDHWRIRAFVRNIENNRVFGIVSYDSFSRLTTGNAAPPRTYGLEIGLKF